MQSNFNSHPMFEHSTAAIEGIVKDFIVRERADKNIGTLDGQTDLIDSGILDSLFLMQLVAFLEDSFGLSLNPESVTPENFASMERIAVLVQEGLA